MAKKTILPTQAELDAINKMMEEMKPGYDPLHNFFTAVIQEQQEGKPKMFNFINTPSGSVMVDPPLERGTPAGTIFEELDVQLRDTEEGGHTGSNGLLPGLYRETRK